MSRTRRLRPVLAMAGALTLAAALSGCAEPPLPGAYVPEGVAYVEPAETAPGPGYFWNYSPERQQWAWWHNDLGWYGD